MSRFAVALLGLALVLAAPHAAAAQTAPIGAPLMLTYQTPNRVLYFSAGYWAGKGKWRFTGPVDVAADNGLLVLDIRYDLPGPWSLAFDYAGGGWQNITFNGAPAAPTISGSVTMANIDLRYRLGSGRAVVDAILGWQYYRARTEDSAAVTSDEARAGGFRIGTMVWVPLRDRWSARALVAYAPAMSVTENFTSSTTTTVTAYNGSFTDAQVALIYSAGPRLSAEAGWRSQRIDFRRPTDVLEHTLDGWFVHLIYRAP